MTPSPSGDVSSVRCLRSRARPSRSTRRTRPASETRSTASNGSRRWLTCSPRSAASASMHTGADVLAALIPRLLEHPETSRRVLQRVAGVFDWCKAQGFVAGDNPTEGLTKVLPKHRTVKAHGTSLSAGRRFESYRNFNAPLQLRGRGEGGDCFALGLIGNAQGAEAPTPVPEPGTMILVAFGLAMLVKTARRRPNAPHRQCVESFRARLRRKGTMLNRQAKRLLSSLVAGVSCLAAFASVTQANPITVRVKGDIYDYLSFRCEYTGACPYYFFGSTGSFSGTFSWDPALMGSDSSEPPHYTRHTVTTDRVRG